MARTLALLGGHHLDDDRTLYRHRPGQPGEEGDGAIHFQVSVIIFYVSIAKVKGGTAPIIPEGGQDVVYSNPLPHVLMLTAIVVGISTTALALALVVRIQEAYGTVEDDELNEIDGARS